MPPLSASLLRRAYAMGVFPMAEDRDDPAFHWIEPRRRAVLPLEAFHIPRSLAKTVRRGRFEVRVDSAFVAVVEACAEPGPNRERTWINDAIIAAYHALHLEGDAHSVECWQGGRLVGGLYGVSLGGAFFGESMFSRAPDASKVALVHLVERLRAGGYRLLDCQFQTDHLRRFGVVEIARRDYLQRLDQALGIAATFYPRLPGATEGAGDGGGAASTQSSTQRS